jgi:hypothetical protein
VVTPQTLRDAEPARIIATGVGFRVLSHHLRERAGAMDDARARLAAGWSGGAATAALARCDRVTRELLVACRTAAACDRTLCLLGERVRAAQLLLADGQVASAVRAAEAADADALLRLAHLTTPDPPPTEPPTEPAAVARWWAALSPAERSRLIADRPDLIGWRDGVPAVARDAANRRLLATVDHSPGLQALAARLDDPGLPRAYLLGLDPAGDGRAIVAVGDPDHATDVVTYVPGVNRGLADVPALVGRTDAIAARAGELGPTRRVSAVLWLGYDAPDGLDVALPRAAHGSEAALDSFADGLRATHVGDRSHNTVLGHSYGSLVAGVTARDRGLDADELVLIGSPGVGVDRAAQLTGIPAGHVWAGAAAGDPVQRFAPGLGQVVVDALTNLRHPFSAHYGDATPDVFLWHGRNPVTEGFGAHVFAAAAAGGHSGYWQGSALDAITEITLGAYPATET